MKKYLLLLVALLALVALPACDDDATQSEIPTVQGDDTANPNELIVTNPYEW